MTTAPTESSTALKSIFVEFFKMQTQIEGVYQQYLPPGMNILHAHILVALHNTPGMSAGELARAVGRPMNGFTTILDALENAHMIERRPHPFDRRALTLHLTPAGEKRFPALSDQLTTAHLAAATLMRTLAGKAAAEQD